MQLGVRLGSLGDCETELGEVALVPGRGGVLEVRLDGETLFSRAAAGRFPDAAELKRAVRDRVAPGRSLGHTDRSEEVVAVQHALDFTSPLRAFGVCVAGWAIFVATFWVIGIFFAPTVS